MFLKSYSLEVRPLFSVPLQIPARQISRPRKQRVHTRFHLGIIEDEFGLAVFLRHRVVTRDSDLAEPTVRSNPIAKYNIVGAIGEQGHACQSQKHDTYQPLKEMPDSRAQHRAHGVQLYASLRLDPRVSRHILMLPCLKSAAIVDNSMLRQANYRICCVRPAASPYGQFRRQVRV